MQGIIMSGIVILPTYNEIENIDIILAQIFKYKEDIHVLVVDDNSPDKTYERVRELAKEKYVGKVHLLLRTKKEGLGKAYIAGFKWALSKKYDYIFEMDADMSHNPKYIPNFLREIKTHDLVIGSRYIKGGDIKGWGIIRKFISRGGSIYSKIILSLPYKDLTGGYKCFKKETLEKINLDKIVSNGYSFQIELTYRVHLAGGKIKEVPITFVDRVNGSSKMSKNIFVEAMKKVLWMRKNKKKIKKGVI